MVWEGVDDGEVGENDCLGKLKVVIQWCMGVVRYIYHGLGRV